MPYSKIQHFLFTNQLHSTGISAYKEVTFIQLNGRFIVAALHVDKALIDQASPCHSGWNICPQSFIDIVEAVFDLFLIALQNEIDPNFWSFFQIAIEVLTGDKGFIAK